MRLDATHALLGVGFASFVLMWFCEHFWRCEVEKDLHTRDRELKQAQEQVVALTEQVEELAGEIQVLRTPIVVRRGG